MKIRTQLIAGIVVFAVLLAIISGFVIATDQQVTRLAAQERIANNISLEVGELGYLSNDYILYREPRQAERWSTKFAQISGEIASLSVDPPEQQVIAGTLAANLKNSRSVFDDITSSPGQTGRVDTTFVQISWSRMEVQNQNMIFEAGRLENLIHTQAEGVKDTRLLLIFTLMVAFALLLLSSYFLGSRRMLRSLGELQKGAEIVGSGDFSHAVDESSADEVGDLARSFNRMTADLRQVTTRKADLEIEVSERKRAEADLAQKNEELTQTHEDLVHSNANLAARESDLTATNDELQALNEELSSAHEELQQNLDELTRAQGEIRASGERYRNLFEKMTEGFAVHEIICDETGKPVDYRFLEINPAFEQLTGLRRDEVVGKPVSEVIPDIGQDWIDIYGAVALTGKPVRFDNYAEPLDRYYEVFSYSPAPRQFAALFSDITSKKWGELNQKLMADVLRVLNRGGELHALIGEILTGIKSSTGFDAIGLRLREGEDYPYYEQDGLTEEFLRGENFLCAKSADGAITRTDDGRMILECTCGIVISGRTDPTMRCFTEGGSFWTNRSSDLLALAPEDDPRVNPRNRCIHDGYQSVALIPVRSGKTILGLLQLNDRREGRYSPEMIRFFEALADNIGLALERKHAEEALYRSEEKLQAVFSILPVGVSVVDGQRVTEANLALERILGLSKDQLVRGDYGGRKYLHPDGTAMTPGELPGTRAIAEQVPVSDVEIRVLSKDGTERWENVSAAPLPGSGAVIVTTDITDRKYNEDTLRLSAEVYQASASRLDLTEMLDDYARILQNYTGCEAIGIRLLDEKGNIPYHVNLGFSEDFFNRESPLSIRSDSCMCINVIRGETDPSLPFYTAGGSFCINATTKFLSAVPDEEKGKTRNVCNQVGYESVALIPIRKGDTILGLLHLADHREGMVPLRTVRILENVALSMGSPILRLQAEEILRGTTQELENLIDYANAPIIVWDPAFRITRFNHAFERLTGRPVDAAIGQPLEILFPTEFREELMTMIRRTLTGERWEAVEIPILNVSGDVKTVLWNSATLYGADGKTVSSVIAQGQDITERKKAEEAYRETSEYLENLIDYANAPIIVWDPTFRITRFNRAFERLTGMAAEDVIGQPLYTILPIAGRAVSMELIRKTREGERWETVEIPIQHISGEVRTVLWNSAALYGADGKTLESTIAQGQDITDRKIAEEELKRRNEELAAIHEELRSTNETLLLHEQELTNKNTDLNALNEELTATQEELHQNVEELGNSEAILRKNEAELKEALVEKEVLLSEIHHRVKNNLAAFISLISLDGTYEASEEGKALKKDLQNRARSMALIHETLYRTRKYSNVDMGVYLTNLVEQIAASYTTIRSVRTVVDAEGTVLDIARATPCGLIINELITNSFKYAFPEPFDCAGKRGEPCTIRISLKKNDGIYLLSVSDNGTGIPPGIDIATTQSLGLKLVNFLARHQLRAKVEVSTSAGSRFEIRFKDTM